MPRNHESPTRADTAVVRAEHAAIRSCDGDPAGTERYGVAFTRRIR